MPRRYYNIKILDLACGSGIFYREFKRLVKDENKHKIKQQTWNSEATLWQRQYLELNYIPIHKSSRFLASYLA